MFRSFQKVVTCVDPEKKDDKTVVDVNSYFVGGKATYTCSAGLELIGVGERFCQTNGHWSGQIPYCRCKWNIYTLSPIDVGLYNNLTSIVFHDSCRLWPPADHTQRTRISGQWHHLLWQCCRVSLSARVQDDLRLAATRMPAQRTMVSASMVCDQQ